MPRSRRARYLIRPLRLGESLYGTELQLVAGAWQSRDQVSLERVSTGRFCQPVHAVGLANIQFMFRTSRDISHIDKLQVSCYSWLAPANEICSKQKKLIASRISPAFLASGMSHAVHLFSKTLCDANI